ncbi:hypothetical protein OQA88_4597 [Cercophora sp. LCS_1]
MRKYQAAPRRDIKSLRRWHKNWNNAAIDPAEHAYLGVDNEGDLICIASDPTAGKEPLRRVIDYSRTLRTLPVWHDKEKQGQVSIHDAGAVQYYSDSKMDGFVSLAIAGVGLVMLVTPVWVLHVLADKMVAKLVTITLFVLVCLGVVSFAMVAKPFEALGTTAA